MGPILIVMASDGPRSEQTDGNHDDQPGAYRNDGVVIIEQRSPAPGARHGKPVPRQRAGLPAPVRKAAVAVAAGAAIQVGLGIAGKLLASRAARGAAEGAAMKALQARGNGKRDRKPERVEREAAPFDDVDAVTETLIVRRTWYRRGK